jgi:hypothetical protein
MQLRGKRTDNSGVLFVTLSIAAALSPHEMDMQLCGLHTDVDHSLSTLNTGQSSTGISPSPVKALLALRVVVIAAAEPRNSFRGNT